MEDYEIEEDRVVNNKSFICCICSNLSLKPMECEYNCATILCLKCLNTYKEKWKNKANDLKFNPIKGLCLTQYNNLDIACSNPNCSEGGIIKLIDLKQHESKCVSNNKNIKKSDLGFDKNYKIGIERLVGNNDTFVCSFDQHIVWNPRECEYSECGKLFCYVCIEKWETRSKKCPNCNNKLKYKPINGAVKKLYREIEIICYNCNKNIKLMDMPKHESEGCTNLKKEFEPKFDNTIFLEILKWDEKAKGEKIKLSQENKIVKLTENSFKYRSALANKGFTSGIHYWEIITDKKNKYEIKVGVSLKYDFKYNDCFCDYDFGFAFFGNGQLRHNSSATGDKYGKSWKTKAILGVLLNMNYGILSFILNGKDLGPAFKTKKLTTGPIYPAVALLHESSCKLN